MAPQGTVPEEAAEVSAPAGKYMAFRLCGEEYGIAILQVREIIGIQDITEVPRAPEFMKGVINLRGRIIPVVDLRLKFGMPPEAYGGETCIIVVSVGPQVAGLIVDTVSEVVDLAPEDLGPAPAFGDRVEARYLKGVGRSREGVLILLDVETILGGEEMPSEESPAP